MKAQEVPYLPINSALVIHEMNKGLNDTKKWQHGEEMFPVRMLDVKTPSTPNDKASLFIEHNKQMMEELQQSLDDCIRECNRALESIGDRASDIFDVTLYLWTKKAQTSSDFVVISASEIAELLGLKKHSKGGFRSRDKENISKVMDLLKLIQLDADMTIEFYNSAKNNRKDKKRWALKSSALLIAARAKETDLTEDDKVIQFEYRWKYKPGEVLVPFLDAPNKRFAYVDRKILEMCPHKEKYEKRLGKAGSWFFKVNLKKRGGIARLRVSTLLNDALIDVNRNCPGKTVDIFENARLSLIEKNIFRIFEYENSKAVGELIARRGKGWVEKWLDSIVILEPPMDLIDRYVPKREELLDPIALQRFKTLGEVNADEDEDSDVVDLTPIESPKVLEKKVESAAPQEKPQQRDAEPSAQLLEKLKVRLSSEKMSINTLAVTFGVSRPFLSAVLGGKKKSPESLLAKIRSYLQ